MTGGSFVLNKSNILMINPNADMEETDYDQILHQIARRSGICLLSVKKGDEIAVYYESHPVKSLIDAFLHSTDEPVFLFSILVLPDLFITDDTIYITKNHILDTGDYFDNIIDKKVDWISVKNERSTEDNLIKRINDGIREKRKILSTSLALSDIGFKNLKDFIDAMKKSTK